MTKNLIICALVLSTAFAAGTAKERTVALAQATQPAPASSGYFVPASFDVEITPLPEDVFVATVASRNDLRFEH